MSLIRPQPGAQTKFLSSKADIAIFGGSAFGGKAGDIRIPIPTPDGFTPLGELRKGDRVFAVDGSIATVIEAYPISLHEDVYEVEFDSGEVLTVDGDHLWMTQTREDRALQREGTVKSTKEIKETLRVSKHYNHFVPLCKPVEIFKGISHSEREVFFNSKRDGHDGEEQAVLSAFRYSHLEVTREVACSLGYKCSPIESNKENDSYQFTVNLDRSISRTIVRVRKSRPCLMRCIAMDHPSHLYLMGESFIPTHNTYSLLLECGRHTSNPLYQGVIFRRQSIQIRSPGGLRDTSELIYPSLGGVLVSNPVAKWTFPSGAQVTMTHLHKESSVLDWQGSQVALMAYDELTHFCLTPDHEVLTREGWKWITDVQVGEFVASLDVNSETCFLPVSDTPSFDYDGEMIEWDHKDGISTKVTPNHQMMVDDEHSLFARNRRFKNAFLCAQAGDSRYLNIGDSRHLNVFRTDDLGKNIRKVRLGKSTIVPYQGKVYCLTVPGTHNFLVRRKGRCHFTGNSYRQFFYMMSRTRSLSGIRPYTRATCNPDADSWVADFLSWWIDQETGYPIPERSGVLRYMIRVDDVVKWGNSRKELVEQWGCDKKDVQSVTFIPSKITDNPIGMKADPSYIGKLKAMSYVERARLLDGNWKVRPSAGMYFPRYDVRIVDWMPQSSEMVRWIRSWDLAASEATDGHDPDYTVGALVGRKTDGRIVIGDIIRVRKKAGDVRNIIKNTAARDGREVWVCIPQDPGQSGREQIQSYKEMLSTYNVLSRYITKNKLTMAEPFASAWQHGQVDMVRANWNEAFLVEAEQFGEPNGRQHDDQIDATATAVTRLPGFSQPDYSQGGLSGRFRNQTKKYPY